MRRSPGAQGLRIGPRQLDPVRHQLRSLLDKDIEKATLRALARVPGYSFQSASLPKEPIVRSWICALENIERIEDDADEPRRIREATAFSARCTRIATLLQHFLETGEDTAFLAHVQRSEDPHRVVAAINEEIDLAPGDLTRGVRPHRASARRRRQTWPTAAQTTGCKGYHALARRRSRSPGPVYERLHLLERQLAIFVAVHRLEKSFVSRLKFLQ
ncbi:hypothetical protein ACVMAJ_005775 [Bradyrhizobium sp. USDA 4448]